MITVENRDTCRAAYIDPKCIQRITEHEDTIDGKAYPYSRVFLKDEKQGHEYFLDVVESKRKIKELCKNDK